MDTEQDPYSITGGFWHAHMGWLFQIDPLADNKATDLEADWAVAFQHKYYYSIAIIMGFMPSQMDDAAVTAAIAAIVAETGATGMRDMGKVMAALKERYAGRMDFGKASAAIKAQLSGPA